MLVGATIITGTLTAIGPGRAARADAPEPSLVDATAKSGIRFRHVSGTREKDWITDVNGSGVAIFDYDGDGDNDLYFVNGSQIRERRDGTPKSKRPRNALYRNDGDWRFVDVSERSGVDDAGWGCGVAVADVDNDGHLDLYVTNNGPNVMFLNRGDGTFRRATSGAEDPGFGASCSFADFDGDGLVDLYVANYVAFDPARAKGRTTAACQYKGLSIFCGPGGLPAQPDRFYRNLGGGRFRDASKAWGLDGLKPSYGLGTIAVDINGDRRLDVVVANDTQANFCLLNTGSGFADAALYLGLAYNDYGVAQAGMGLAAGDLRGTGRFDLFVTNFEDDTNTLYLNEGEIGFMENTFPSGLGGPSYRCLGWGTVVFDVDCDGDLDVFVANGHVAPQVDQLRASEGYRQPNQLFLNDGKGRFRDARTTAGGGLSVKKSSRGLAHGDLDNDGDLDLVVSNIDESPTLLENTTLNPGAWVAIELRGAPPSNAAAIGARVTVTSNGRRQLRSLQSGMSFASQSQLRLHFGLGSARGLAEVQVDWPSGRTEYFPPAPLGRLTRLEEGAGKTRKPQRQKD